MASRSIEASKALHSGDYVERYNRKPLDRVAALAQRMRVGNTDELADFACGNGMLLQAIGDRRGAYHGVDFSDDFIRSARAAAERLGLSNYHFHCRDIVEFCERNPQRFEVGSALDFSEHIDDEAFVRIFSAIHGSLKRGGRLFLHTPNRGFFVEALKDRGILTQFPEHIAVRGVDRTVELLTQAGFERDAIRAEIIPHYNVLKLLHPLRRMPLLGHWFEARIWIEAHA
jgi:cyclopropane fatty-acyl-phospholipid synthase-like methyltransferase